MRATSLSTRSSYCIRTVESVCSILNVNDNVPIARYIAVCLRLSIAQLERSSGTELFRRLSSGEP